MQRQELLARCRLERKALEVRGADELVAVALAFGGREYAVLAAAE